MAGLSKIGLCCCVILCLVLFATDSYAHPVSSPRRKTLGYSTPFIFSSLRWGKTLKNAGLVSVDVGASATANQNTLPDQQLLAQQAQSVLAGSKRKRRHRKSLNMAAADLAYEGDYEALAPVSPPGPGPTPPPVDGCPPPVDSCSFFFTINNQRVQGIPSFPLSKIAQAAPDAFFDPVISVDLHGTTVPVTSANSQTAQYLCGPDTLPDDNQFYATQDRVQVRTFQSDPFKYAGYYVKLDLTAQIDYFNMVFNLNGADDGNTASFPFEQRCILFKLTE